MILENTADLESFVKALHSQFRNSNAVIDLSTFKEYLAKSQGFKAYEKLTSRLPIMLDCSYNAANVFIELFLKSNPPHRGFYYSPEIFKVAALEYKPFPMAAGQKATLKIRISWEDGSISQVYEAFAPLDYSSSDDFRKSNSYVLRPSLFENEYSRLLEALRPLVKTVTAGYTDAGDGNTSWFNDAATAALQMIERTISEFEFSHNETEGVRPEAVLYADDFVSLRNVESGMLTEVYGNGRFIFDHSYNDIQLRQIIALEIINSGLAINDEILLRCFQLLRDACRENHEDTFLRRHSVLG